MENIHTGLGHFLNIDPIIQDATNNKKPQSVQLCPQ